MADQETMHTKKRVSDAPGTDIDKLEVPEKTPAELSLAALPGKTGRESRSIDAEFGRNTKWDEAVLVDGKRPDASQDVNLDPSKYGEIAQKLYRNAIGIMVGKGDKTEAIAKYIPEEATHRDLENIKLVTETRLAGFNVENEAQQAFRQQFTQSIERLIQEKKAK